MKEWVKLYTESNHDPLIGSLSWEHRGIWSALLILAGELDHRDEDGVETGILDTTFNVAWHIRCESETFNACLKELTARGMINENNGILCVTNYTKRQRRAPSASREAVAERVQQYREKKKADGNEDVTTLQDDVTTLEREKNREEENREDIEPEREIAPEAPPSPAEIAEPIVLKPKKAKNTPMTDERRNHPAIKAFKTVTKEYPRIAVWDLVIDILGEKPDIGLLKACFIEWVSHGWKVENLAWLKEWYVNGGPPKNQNGSNGSRANANHRQYPGPARKPNTEECHELEPVERGNLPW